MKQLHLLLIPLLLIITMQSSIAQSKNNEYNKWQYTLAGALMMSPFASLDQTNFGFGLSGKAAYYLREKISATLMTGYDYFPGKAYSFSLDMPPFSKIKKKGIPFGIIPFMAGINYSPVHWFYLSGCAGMVMGGSKDDFKTSIGYEPAIGFLIPCGKNEVDIGLNYLYTNLTASDALPAMGGVNTNHKDFAQAAGIAIGYTF